MKIQLKLFIVPAFLLLGEVPSQAQTEPTNKAELIQEVHKIAGRCLQEFKKVEGKSCLWTSWRWHHGKCLLSPIKCNQLHALEDKKKKGFTRSEYEAILADMKRYVRDKEKDMLERIERKPFSVELARDISLDIQALATGCAVNTRSLQGILNPIEKLYKEVFGKKCHS